MKVHDRKSQFGWPNDNGTGEKLIQQIMAGKKTATAGPRCLYLLSELRETYENIGTLKTVIDKNENPRCNILILDVFETTFEILDPRLVEGEGFGGNYEAFRQSHREAWRDLVERGKLDLGGDTVLVIELFKLVND
jgi:uncharacterized protein YhfF